MNIAFDATAILGPMSKNRGIGNYGLALFEHLISQDKTNNYFFFNVFEEFSFSNVAKSLDNITEEYFYVGKDNVFVRSPEYKGVFQSLFTTFIKKNNIDLFINTSPFDGHVLPYEKEWFQNVYTVCIVYDLIPYVMKDVYLTDPSTEKWYRERLTALSNYDKYLVISKSVLDDMVNYLHYNPNDIHVIYSGVGTQYQEIEVSSKNKKNLFERYQISKEFIMCTGGDDYRKNIDGLIEAYSGLSEDLKSLYQLVIVCKLSDSAITRYTDQINQLNLKGNVILTNYVSDDDLVTLYNLAKIIAFPSKYEGFGLPVVEGWSCGKPVLTSNNSSLGEISENSAFQVDPFSISSITEGLTLALTDHALLDEMTEKGKEKVKKFQWTKVADVTMEFFDRLEIVNRELSNNQKIAFFSPLPPLQSGISDYSFDIIQELADFFMIDVYIDDGYEVAADLPKNVKIFSHKKYLKNKNNYIETIYQMGNSLFHSYMIPYIRKYKGILVLHDYNLSGMLRDHTVYKTFNFHTYKKYVKDDTYLPEIKNYFDGLLIHLAGDHTLVADLTFNGFVVNYASKIIVHSDYAKNNLLSRNIERDVTVINLYAETIEYTKAAAKLKLNLSDQKLSIGCFGMIHETKRIIPILHALSYLVKECSNFEFFFVGHLTQELEEIFYDTVSRFELGNYIHVTGFVTLEEFSDHMDACDICLNLRYPYNGETSASFMRMLGKGKCTIINDIGAFSEIPDEACCKIENVKEMSESDEIKLIYESLKRLVSEDNTRKMIENHALNFALEHLNIKNIAKQYEECIVREDAMLLSEELLEHIAIHELREKHYDQNEINQLVKTFAYLYS